MPADPSRLLLKVSGGALGPEGATGIEAESLARISQEITAALKPGRVQLGIVVGGGNFLRGRDVTSIERVTADHMGMLATIMNGLALQASLESRGVATRVLSAFPIYEMVEPFVRRTAVEHLDAGRVLILVGGTGLPYFSTDSTAAVRALEIGASKILKGTSVRGVFSEDPKHVPAAKFYDEITYDEILEKELRVIDATAASLCRENRVPIEVFDMTVAGNIEKAIRGERLGTLVRA